MKRYLDRRGIIQWIVGQFLLLGLPMVVLSPSLSAEEVSACASVGNVYLDGSRSTACSGYFVSPDGMFLTVPHCLLGAETIAVVPYGKDGKRFPAQVYNDPIESDRVRLQVHLAEESVPPIALATELPEVGDDVYIAFLFQDLNSDPMEESCTTYEGTLTHGESHPLYLGKTVRADVDWGGPDIRFKRGVSGSPTLREGKAFAITSAALPTRLNGSSVHVVTPTAYRSAELVSPSEWQDTMSATPSGALLYVTGCSPEDETTLDAILSHKLDPQVESVALFRRAQCLNAGLGLLKQAGKRLEVNGLSPQELETYASDMLRLWLRAGKKKKLDRIKHDAEKATLRLMGRAIEINPLSDIHFGRGLFYLLHIEDFDAAIEDLERALDLDENAPEARFFLAVATILTDRSAGTTMMSAFRTSRPSAFAALQEQLRAESPTLADSVIAALDAASSP